MKNHLALVADIKQKIKQKYLFDSDKLKEAIHLQIHEEAWWLEGKLFACLEILDYLRELETGLQEEEKQKNKIYSGIIENEDQKEKQNNLLFKNFLNDKNIAY